MSIATLKEELLRELAAAALGGFTHPRPITGAGSDLVDWSGRLLRTPRERVFEDGPRLIVAHVKHGDCLWFAPGAFTSLCEGPQRVVVRHELSHDGTGVTHIRMEGEHGFSSALFLADGSVARFLANVLNGHVQDA